MPLVAYANRLPVTRGRQGWRPSAGGLVSALGPALESRKGTWVGWDGGAGEVPRRVEGLDVELLPVALSRREVEDYYHGFANRTLWPLLHGLIEQPVFEGRWWTAYRDVNERFAAVEVDGGGLRWVHDYHLMLVPRLLRHARGGPIGYFLHVPFPPPEVYARLPWREQVLDGLLGADVVSFHTERYRDNFVRTCALLRDDVRIEGQTIALARRRILTAAHPISIDARTLEEDARSDATERSLRGLRAQFGGRRILLGIDRLDYTKGIIERLQAIELLLERRPELRGRVTFVQIAVPSRGEVREYRELRRHVEELVGRINGRFTDPGGDVPVYYLYRGVPYERLLAYYRLADVCLVTPLADGMNLVAKEFVTAQAARGGVGALVLSEFTGAAVELGEALLCNPFDVAGLAGAIELALELDEDDRRRRIERMAAAVARRDVYWWTEQELAPAGDARTAATRSCGPQTLRFSARMLGTEPVTAEGGTMSKSIRDTMTADPRSISPSDPIVEAARLMRDKDIGSLPVTDEGRLVGMVTDRDIAVRVIAEGKSPESTTVGEVFSHDPVTAQPDQDLDEALRLMAQHQVRRLPVVEDDRLVGILAQADVALEEKEKKTGELVESISQPSEAERR